MTIGVIISTYNNPRWLEKTLWGYACQTMPADEIIIADDGSTEDTRLLVERFAETLPIKYVWHEDKGFRKTKILNRALAEAMADYLILPTRTLFLGQISYLHMLAMPAKAVSFRVGAYVCLWKRVRP